MMLIGKRVEFGGNSKIKTLAANARLRACQLRRQVGA